MSLLVHPLYLLLWKLEIKHPSKFLYYKESHRKVYYHLGEQISKKILRFPTSLETKGYEFFNGYLLITFLYSFQGHPQASARAGSQGGSLFSGLDVRQDYRKMHTEKKQQIYKIERGASSRTFMSDAGLGYLTIEHLT